MIVSGKDFLGGQPAQVIKSASDAPLNIPPKEERKQNWLQKQGQGLVSDAKGVYQDLKQGALDIGERQLTGQQNISESTLQVLGQGAKTASKVVFEEPLKILGRMLPQSAQDKIKQGGSAVLESVVNIPGVKEALSSIDKWAQENPGLAADAGVVGDIAGTFLGAGAAKEGGALAKEGLENAGKAVVGTGVKAGKEVAENVAPIISKASVAMEAPKSIAQDVLRSTRDMVKRGKETVGETIDQSLRLKSLPEPEAKAIRTGLDESVLNFVKSSDTESVKAYKKMTQLAKEGVGNLRGPQAKEVVGKTILDKAVTPVIKRRDVLGKEIGDLIEKLPGADTPISIQKELDEFTKILENVGVKVGSEDNELLDLITKGGKLYADNTAVKGDLAAYRNMYNRIKDGVATPRELHKIRQATFKELGLAKARQQTFSDQADDIAEQFRSILARPIEALDKRYMPLNVEYAKTMKALTDFVKYTGYKGDISKLSTQALRVGEVAQRVLGNASARPQEVIDAIANLADEAGMGIGKQIKDQIRFSDLIDNFYGSTQTRSLAGQVGRGVKSGAEGVVEDIATNGPIGGAVKSVGRGVKAILGKTEKEQQKALEAFLDHILFTAE